MKKTLCLLALLLCLFIVLPACAEETPQDTSEWTVMFYFCGSDLESGHSYASGNLEEISYCLDYATVLNAQLSVEDAAPAMEDVNVVIQTGGSKQWHAQNLGMDVRTDALQRWHFRPARNTLGIALSELEKSQELDAKSIVKALADAVHDSAKMELMQDLPLASMAAPETLADFIRWGAENYPARKYALVLWDHGTGAINGLLIDELFDGDTMRLDELKAALTDSGVHFEALLFDACLMANLETAYAVKDSADWMIASEELVAGKGSAMYSWLQQLYCTPQWGGDRLGRWVCEMTQGKYAQETNDQAENTLTWSVIDLSKIDRLAAAFDRFFAVCNNVYVNDADFMRSVCEVFNDAFEFGLGDADMIDLARIPFHPFCILGLERDLYVELLDALSDAVVYNTHGPNRASAGGLSFCYAAGVSPAKLDDYAKVCPSVHYLALLDAINPGWHAPEWVLEQTEKLPEIVDMQEYQIHVEKTAGADGSPSIAIVDGFPCVWDVYVNVSRLNPRTGNIVRLGSSNAYRKWDENANRMVFYVESLTNWPALEGVHCSAELVSGDYLGKMLYNVPIQIEGETYLLRCGVEGNGNSVVYGLWEGYDADSGVYSRNVVPLLTVAGRDCSLLYPIDGTEGSRTRYEASEPMTMYRSMEITFEPLEPGTYYMDYWVEDIFMRDLPVGRCEVQWDGTSLTIPSEADWQGELLLTMAEQ